VLVLSQYHSHVSVFRDLYSIQSQFSLNFFNLVLFFIIFVQFSLNFVSLQIVQILPYINVILKFLFLLKFKFKFTLHIYFIISKPTMIICLMVVTCKK